MLELRMRTMSRHPAKSINAAARAGIAVVTAHHRPLAYIVDAVIFDRYLRSVATVAGLLEHQGLDPLDIASNEFAGRPSE